MSFLDSITSGLTGLLTGGQSNKQDAAGQAAINSAKNLTGPSAQALQVALQKEVEAGTITPEQYTAILQDPNAMQNILEQIDPTYTQATNTALGQLQNIASSNGMTPQFQNELDQANEATNRNLQGQYGAIQQAAQQQGVGGSGLTTAAKLNALQTGANSNSMAGEQAAANAQNNALQAIYGSANLGQSAQGQAYNEKANIAQAQNAINNFNTQNKNNAAVYNTGAANQAQYANLQNKQNVANTNTNTANQQAIYNAQAPETVYQNQLGQVGAVNNAAKTASSVAQNLGSTNNSTISNGLGLLGSLNSGANPISSFDATAALSGLPWSDERLKENVKDFDADDFLNHITGHKWNYKSSTGLGTDEHVGPMAQDIEKSKDGKDLVKNTPMGKKVDYSKAGGHIFSALADIHKRVKSLEGGGATFNDKQDNMKKGKL